MIYYVCAVRDRATDVYGQPMFVAHVAAALRIFGDEINGSQSMLSRHPEDFDLYLLGEYDDASGSFNCGSPRQIAVGKDCKKGNGNGIS